jgi:hypothetical protein
MSNQAQKKWIVGFEVFTAVAVKNPVLWDVAPCGSFKNRRFGRRYLSHLQGKRIRNGR